MLDNPGEAQTLNALNALSVADSLFYEIPGLPVPTGIDYTSHDENWCEDSVDECSGEY